MNEQSLKLGCKQIVSNAKIVKNISKGITGKKNLDLGNTV